MFAGVVFADILEAFRRFFTSLRFVQNDTVLPRVSRFRLSSEAGNADRNLPTASCFRISKDKTEPL